VVAERLALRHQAAQAGAAVLSMTQTEPTAQPIQAVVVVVVVQIQPIKAAVVVAELLFCGFRQPIAVQCRLA